ncbi:hypothetical protein D3C86_1370280 [compost metagenome]
MDLGVRGADAELAVQRADLVFDRLLGEMQAVRDGLVAMALGDQPDQVVTPRRELGAQRGRLAAVMDLLGELRIQDHQPTQGAVDGPFQGGDVPDGRLEQIGPSVRLLGRKHGEQRGVPVVGEQHHPDLGQVPPEGEAHLKAVDAAPELQIQDHDVRGDVRQLGEGLGRIPEGGDHREAGLGGECRAQQLAEQALVLDDGKANGVAHRGSPCGFKHRASRIQWSAARCAAKTPGIARGRTMIPGLR